MSGSGWFRRQQTLLTSSESSAAKRDSGRQSFSVSRPLKRRGVALTASSAALVLGAGVMIVAFASPGSHASLVSSAGPVNAYKPLQPAADLQLVSVTPAAGAKGVNGTSAHPGAVLRAAGAQFADADAVAVDRGPLGGPGRRRGLHPHGGVPREHQGHGEDPGRPGRRGLGRGSDRGQRRDARLQPEPELHHRLVRHHAAAAAAGPARVPAADLDVQVRPGDQPGRRQGPARRRLQRARRDLQPGRAATRGACGRSGRPARATSCTSAPSGRSSRCTA